MKHLRIKTKLFQRVALTLLLAVAGITNALAMWVGNSVIKVNQVSYNASAFNGHDFGTFDLNNYTLLIGGYSELYDDGADWKNGGDFRMCYKIDNGNSIEIPLTGIGYANNNNKYESSVDNSIDLSGLSSGAHKLSVWFKVMKDGTWYYDSNSSADYVAKFTIAPTAKIAPDGNLWTTFYCGDQTYQLDKNEACAYYATLENSKVILHKLMSNNDVIPIPKRTAVIIVGDNPDNKETASIGITAIDDVGDEYADNVLHGVDVATDISSACYLYGATKIYMLGDKSGFGFYPLSDNMTVPARKAFIALDDTNFTRGFSIDFEDDGTTGIRTIDNGLPDNDSWYSLDGRKFNGKPTAKGVYINNGKKVILK